MVDASQGTLRRALDIGFQQEALKIVGPADETGIWIVGPVDIRQSLIRGFGRRQGLTLRRVPTKFRARMHLRLPVFFHNPILF